MNRDFIYVLVIVVLAGVLALVYSNGEVAKVELMHELVQQDVLIEGYRDQQSVIYNDIDSIEKLRYEKDTTTYRLRADSLERIFAERFGK